MGNVINLLVLPAIKCLLWLPRTVPTTTGVVILLCVIHGFRGDIADVRAIWGLDPGKPYSWLTHAFLHFDNYHLMAVIGLFAPAGALIEVYTGKLQGYSEQAFFTRDMSDGAAEGAAAAVWALFTVAQPLAFSP